jgi:hypothetical protein
MHPTSTRDQTNIRKQEIENIGAAGGSQLRQNEFRESGFQREMPNWRSRFLTALSARFGMTKDWVVKGFYFLRGKS